MTQSLQVNLVQRLSLKDRIENCMTNKCTAVTKAAESVIEMENKKRQSQKSKYSVQPEEYMEHKYSSVDSVIKVMEAEECLRNC